MFAYCGNDPVDSADSIGTRPYNVLMTDSPGGGHKGPQPRDITDELNQLMRTNADMMKSYLQNTLYPQFSYSPPGIITPICTPACDGLSALYFTGLFFAGKVKTGGDWDLKNTKYAGEQYYIYNGTVYSGEDIGNIHYGYVGSAVFGPEILHICAGGYQVYSGSRLEYWMTLFDEPRDYDMVEYGIQLYKEGI